MRALAADMQTDLKEVICYPDRVIEKIQRKFNRTPEIDEIQVLFNLNNRIRTKKFNKLQKQFKHC